MLAIIAYASDKSGKYEEIIDGILDDMSSNDIRCKGATQQTANGLYRAVEMAAVVAYESQNTLGSFSL